jgi:hypothetical protein
VALLLFAGCKKDKPEVIIPPIPVNPAPGKKVFVVNEGGFGASDASISLYDAEKNEVEQNRYGNQNNNESPGDVAQSMIRHNDEYYIVVNNSNKIIVCDLNLKKKAEITGLTQPRYISPIGNNLAFVSQFANQSVAVVNLASRTVVKQINLPGFGGEMVSKGNKTFLASGMRNYVYVLANDQQVVIDSVFAGYGSAHVLLDKNNKVWVMSLGNWNGPETPKLTRFNPETYAVEASFDFTKQDFVSRLTSNPTGDTLYYLHNGVRRLPISASSLPVASFISTGAGAYGVRVNPKFNHIYVSDAINFVEPSLITIYSAKGDSLRSFRAGRNAGDFLFD